MKIAVVGAGNIGGLLAVKWAASGHEVVFATRGESEKATGRVIESGGKIGIDAIPAAIEAADVVTLAVPGNYMDDFLGAHGDKLNGKVVIDAVNKIGQEPTNSLTPILTASPEALYYRAFNSLGWEIFLNPLVAGEQASMVYCGPGPESAAVGSLIEDIGLRPVYLGDNEQLPQVDAMLDIYFALAFGQKHGRRLAFKILHEPA